MFINQVDRLGGKMPSTYAVYGPRGWHHANFRNSGFSGSVEVYNVFCLKCENCGAVFLGRPNRRTCSIGCRRSLEYARREWERRAVIVRYYERNAHSEYLTKKQRANWQAQFEAANAKLGPRP